LAEHDPGRQLVRANPKGGWLFARICEYARGCEFECRSPNPEYEYEYEYEKSVDPNVAYFFRKTAFQGRLFPCEMQILALLASFTLRAILLHESNRRFLPQ